MADLNLMFSLNNFNCDNPKLKNPQLINDITCKRTEIVDVIESLGAVLTNENKDIRRRGVEFLSWLLSQLPLNFLSEKELEYFSAFYCDRLKDHHSIIPAALEGILSLVHIPTLPVKSTSDILHVIFQFVTCQAQLAKDRYTFYRILQTCTSVHFECVKNMGGDLLFGVIASIEGETDPKNLLFIFSFLPQLLARLQVDHLSKDVFEVLSVYFPVDFTSIKKDDVVITREDLAEGLRTCLCSTTQLAAECLPLILEKLDSTLKTAKVDSYKLLQSCCERLDASLLQPSLSVLWRILQRDLLPPLDPVVQQAALLALTSVTGTLNNSSEADSNKFLDDIIITTRSLISKPGDSLFLPAMKILEAICAHSPLATRRVLLELEVLCRHKNYSDLEQQVLLEATTPFLVYLKAGEACLEYVVTFTLEAAQLGCVKVKALAFTALHNMFNEISISEKLRLAVYNAISYSLRESAEILPECLKLLRLAATLNSDVLTKLYAELETQFNSNKLELGKFFEISAALVDLPALTSHLINNFVMFGKNPDHSAVACASLLQACRNTGITLFTYSIYDVVLDIIVWWIRDGTRSSLEPLSCLFKEVVACRSAEEQNETLTFCTTFLFPPLFENEAMVILIEGALGALHPSVVNSHLDQLIPRLVELSNASNDRSVRLSAGRLLATLVNKLEVETARRIVEMVKLPVESCTSSDYGRSVELLAWVIKGALLRGLPGLDEWLSLWFSLLNNCNTSRHVALATKCLLQDEPVFLNVNCHCTVRFLYRQRLFCYLPSKTKCLPSITDQAIRDNYLLALVQLAAGVQLEVLLSEETSVAAVVSLAVKSSDPSVLQPALELLRMLLENKSKLFADYITSLLPALLKLSTPPMPLPVRRISLKCLHLAGCYPTQLILPFKAEVVRELLQCLDDRKRVVRAEAIKARTCWCLVGAMDEGVPFPS